MKKGLTESVQESIDLIFRLYRSGLNGVEIQMELEMSEPTFWRQVRQGGGFTPEDKIEHVKSRKGGSVKL